MTGLTFIVHTVYNLYILNCYLYSKVQIVIYIPRFDMNIMSAHHAMITYIVLKNLTL